MENYNFFLVGAITILTVILISNKTFRNSWFLSEKKMSLFEQLGGEKSIDAVVDAFYKKVLADKRVLQFFEGTDMAKQHKMQKQFLTYAFGGPNNYNGKAMGPAHKKLREEKGLNESHFNAIAELLQSTLVDFKVPEDKIAEVMTIAGSVKNDILGLN